ncbi:hypothetical protein PYJP_09860 [Pyrofollis japonicus]|uniref:hypothetical protein n=1 Tax=Pyrofollis japonicus TaxID=3060460 RepID=UPI00295BD94A|nr:hypothetical protein [Pyrofollis japonicus]BEP17634.1 hypothetical protein PYJP_09860 [Pyrofollis japonicus]
MSFSRLAKQYNTILLPMTALLFALLYAAIRINSKILLFLTIALIIFAPIIAYFLTISIFSKKTLKGVGEKEY